MFVNRLMTIPLPCASIVVGSCVNFLIPLASSSKVQASTVPIPRVLVRQAVALLHSPLKSQQKNRRRSQQRKPKNLPQTRQIQQLSNIASSTASDFLSMTGNDNTSASYAVKDSRKTERIRLLTHSSNSSFSMFSCAPKRPRAAGSGTSKVRTAGLRRAAGYKRFRRI